MKICDNGDLLLLNGWNYHTNKIGVSQAFVKNKNSSSDYANYMTFLRLTFFDSFDNPKQWKPKSLQSYDYNNKRWVVGRAQNIYGEWHAVLLVPLTE